MLLKTQEKTLRDSLKVHFSPTTLEDSVLDDVTPGKVPELMSPQRLLPWRLHFKCVSVLLEHKLVLFSNYLFLLR